MMQGLNALPACGVNTHRNDAVEEGIRTHTHEMVQALLSMLGFPNLRFHSATSGGGARSTLFVVLSCPPRFFDRDLGSQHVVVALNCEKQRAR